MKSQRESSLKWSKENFTFISRCPITCGHETVMTWSIFEKMCFANQEREETAVCSRCRGYAIPLELTLADKTDHITHTPAKPEKGGKDMAKVIGNGACEICKKKDRTLRLIKEKKCCASCEFIWRAAQNAPESLAAALKMSGHAGFGTQDQAALQQLEAQHEIDAGLIGKLRSEAESWKNLYEEANLELQQTVQPSAQTVQDLENRRQADQAAIESLRQDYENLEHAYTEANATIAGLRTAAAAPKDSVLLDMALGVLAGSITGIGPDTIYQLRNS